jgi:hypothetical protein
MQSSSRSRIFNPTLAGASPATDTISICDLGFTIYDLRFTIYELLMETKQRASIVIRQS